MDPSLEFAQAVLDQLRRDLKRFARGRAAELDRVLGRSPQYFRRVAPKNLGLTEAFAAMRFIGFRPSDYLSSSSSQQNLSNYLPGFFLKRIPRAPHPTLKLDLDLDDFTSWGYSLATAPAEKQVRLTDGEELIRSMGFSRITRDDLTDACQAIFSVYSRHRPSRLSPDSLHGLTRSILNMVSVAREEGSLSSACRLLDLAFHLESLLPDQQMRHALFQEGALLSKALGNPSDAIWCYYEALHLAQILLSPHIDINRQSWDRLVKDLETRFEIESAPQNTSNQWKLQGWLDTRRLLATLESDRKTARISAGSLDRILGAKNIYSSFRNRGKDPSLLHWARLMRSLEIDPVELSRRLKAWPSPIPSLAAIAQRMPPNGVSSRSRVESENRQTATCRRLWAWAREVKVPLRGTPSALKLEREIFQAPDPKTAFGPIMDTLGSLMDSGVFEERRISPYDAELLGDGLLRAADVLRRRGRLRSSGNLLGAFFNLQAWDSPGPRLAHGLRVGSYFSVDCGSLPFASMFAQIATEVDLRCHAGIDKLVFDWTAQAHVAYLSADYQVAKTLFRSCLEAGKHSPIPLERWILCTNLGVTALRMDDLPTAREWIEEAETNVSQNADGANVAELLAAKAELLSRTGNLTEPIILLESAASQLDPVTYPDRAVVMGLRHCEHLLRFDRKTEARQRAGELLKLTRSLGPQNPIGQAAVLELARIAAQSAFDPALLKVVERKILYPNLPIPRAR